jgi:hypothetical protein
MFQVAIGQVGGLHPPYACFIDSISQLLPPALTTPRGPNEQT